MELHAVRRMLDMAKAHHDPVVRPGSDQQLGRLVDSHLVVAKHRRLGAELGHVLDQVVGEGVVVVDHRELRHHMASAISIALNIAPAFSSVSSYSRSGLESATTPHPAWT